MSAAAIARERAQKAALAANMAEESDEVEACQTFFKRTGGGDNWSDKVKQWCRPYEDNLTVSKPFPEIFVF